MSERHLLNGVSVLYTRIGYRYWYNIYKIHIYEVFNLKSINKEQFF